MQGQPGQSAKSLMCLISSKSLNLLLCVSLPWLREMWRLEMRQVGLCPLLLLLLGQCEQGHSIGPICKAPNRLGKLSIMGSLWPIPVHTCLALLSFQQENVWGWWENKFYWLMCFVQGIKYDKAVQLKAIRLYWPNIHQSRDKMNKLVRFHQNWTVLNFRGWRCKNKLWKWEVPWETSGNS